MEPDCFPCPHLKHTPARSATHTHTHTMSQNIQIHSNAKGGRFHDRRVLKYYRVNPMHKEIGSLTRHTQCICIRFFLSSVFNRLHMKSCLQCMPFRTDRNKVNPSQVLTSLLGMIIKKMRKKENASPSVCLCSLDPAVAKETNLTQAVKAQFRLLVYSADYECSKRKNVGQT